jgi:hypothetical protein
MSKIFKPRRGKVSTMLGTKASTVLAAGEMFFEVPDTGVGTGRGRIMVGDGSSTYVNLAGANNNTKGANSQAAKYFFPFTEDETIIHPGTSNKTVKVSSSISSDTVATYLNNAKSGNTLKTIIHNLREAIYTNACDIAMLNNDKLNKVTADGYYQPIGSYAAANHNHNSSYASKSLENNIGAIYQDANSNDRWIPKQSNTTILSVSVPAGIYIATGYGRADMFTGSARTFVAINEQAAMLCHHSSYHQGWCITNFVPLGAYGNISLNFYAEDANTLQAGGARLKAMRIK